MGHREDYQRKIEAQLREWSQKIDELTAKVEGAEADAKAEYERRITELRSKHRAVQDRLDEIRRSSDEAWETLKVGMESAMNQFKRTLDEALSKFE